MLDAHGEDVDADDEGDEEVQVVAGAQCVDVEAQGAVVRIVRPLLGLCRHTKTHRQTWKHRHGVSDGALKMEVSHGSSGVHWGARRGEEGGRGSGGTAALFARASRAVTSSRCAGCFNGIRLRVPAAVVPLYPEPPPTPPREAIE